MTTTIFMELLTALDASVRVQARNIQLSADKCAIHMHDVISQERKTILQTHDLGIIKCFKAF